VWVGLQSYNVAVARKRWLWAAFGGLCILSVGIGWLARPEDPYAALRPFHPDEDFFRDDLSVSNIGIEGLGDSGLRFFYFQADPALVRRVLKPASTAGHFRLPSGREVVFEELGPYSVKYEYATCEIWAHESGEHPWPERAWVAIKHRLGLN